MLRNQGQNKGFLVSFLYMMTHYRQCAPTLFYITLLRTPVRCIFDRICWIKNISKLNWNDMINQSSLCWSLHTSFVKFDQVAKLAGHLIKNIQNFKLWFMIYFWCKWIPMGSLTLDTKWAPEVLKNEITTVRLG
jgi:hypothetical protein